MLQNVNKAHLKFLSENFQWNFPFSLIVTYRIRSGLNKKLEIYPFRQTRISKHRKKLKTLCQKIVGPNRQQLQTKDKSTKQSLKKDVLIIEKIRSHPNTRKEVSYLRFSAWLCNILCVWKSDLANQMRERCFSSVKKNVHPIRTTNHAFVLQ